MTIDDPMHHVDITVVPSASSMQLAVNELPLVWQHEEKAGGLSKPPLWIWLLPDTGACSWSS